MQPSMPSPRTSTFIHFRASMSSLSHSMTCRPAMAAGSTGTSSSSRSLVSTNPPGWVPSCRGKPMSSRASAMESRRRRSAKVQVQFGGMLRQHALVGPAPHLGGQHAGDVLGQAHDLADVADGATREPKHITVAQSAARSRP